MSDSKPLALYYRGAEVTNLQENLIRLGFTVPDWEINNSTFGKGTKSALMEFQKNNQLPASGILDYATKIALENAVKNQAGSTGATSTNNQAGKPTVSDKDGKDEVTDHTDDIVSTREGDCRIEGRLYFEDGQNPSQVTIRAYHREFGVADLLLGETVSDQFGFFCLTYDAQQSRRNIEIRVLNEQGSEIKISSTKINAASSEVLNLMAPDGVGRPAPEFDRIASDISKKNITRSKLACAVETCSVPDISLLHSSIGWDARLLALYSLAAQKTTETKIPQKVLYALYRTGLPQSNEILSEVNLDTFEQAIRKAIDSEIVFLTEGEIESAKKAFLNFIRPMRLASKANGALSSISELLDQTDIGGDQVKRDLFADLYFASLENGTNVFDDIDTYNQTHTVAYGFTQEEIDDLKIQGKLSYLTGSNALLNKSFQSPVVRIGNLSELAGQGFYNASAWVARLEQILDDHPELEMEDLIPEAYKGDGIEARLHSYTEDMARKVRNSFPSTVIAKKIETTDIDLGTDSTVVKDFLETAAGNGFKIGHSLIDDYTDEATPETTVAAVKRLQRLYQTTPNDDSMNMLWQAGFQSASDIAMIPRSRFIKAFGPQNESGLKFATLEEALLVHAKAQQIHSVALSAFSAARHLSGTPMPYVLKPAGGQYEEARNKIITRYPSLTTTIPTMETLFGSLDFCGCRHCRSVLSPAAYFVDLMQFIDDKSPLWDNFLKIWNNTHTQSYSPEYNVPYKVLTDRRPDLPNLPLTCENTHTAMPYIDIVNEILENLAIQDLDELPIELPAYDTGEARTEDLLAEPQNILPEAYEILKVAPYPMNLPFDLWIETFRRFCAHHKTPFWKLLDTFRIFDELNPASTKTVKAASTEPVNTAGGPAEIDGVTLAAGDSILLKDQADPRQNGVYIAGGSAPFVLQRDPDFDTAEEMEGLVVKVDNGKKYGGSFWRLIEEEEITIGETALPFEITYGRETVFFEYLGLTKSEVDLLTSADFSISWPDLYGNLTEGLKYGQNLARRLGISYLELADIVNTSFVNPKVHSLKVLDALAVYVDFPIDLIVAQKCSNAACEGCTNDLCEEFATFEGKLDDLEIEVEGFIVNDWIADFKQTLVLLPDGSAPCDFSKTILRYVDDDSENIDAKDSDFLKINLFVRIWKKLGWTIEETDRALSVFLPPDSISEPMTDIGPAMRTALVYLAHLKSLDERLQIRKNRRLKILTFWSALSTPTHTRLYEELFLHSGIAEIDAVFDHPLGRYLESPNPPLIRDHMATLQGALNLSSDEIEKILEANVTILDLPEEMQDPEFAQLTLNNISLLYRYSLLSQGLRLSIRELLALIELSGIDPLQTVESELLSSIENDNPFKTILFADMAEEIKESGFTVEDLEYLLLHRFDPVGKYRRSPAELRMLVKTLREGIGRIETENALPANPEEITNEYLKKKLEMVLAPDVVARFLAFWAATTEFEAVKADVPDGDKLDPDDFSEKPDIRVYWEETEPGLGTQHLTFKGALSEKRLKDLTDSTSTPELQVELLNEIRHQSVHFPVEEWAGTLEYEVSIDITGNQDYELLDPEDFEDLPYLQVWSEKEHVQFLRLQGILTNEQKEKILNLANPESPLQQNLLADLLSLVQEEHASLNGVIGEIETFFNDFLTSSFVEWDIFSSLFGPGLTGASFPIDGLTEADRRTTFLDGLLSYIQEKQIRQFIGETLATNLAADPGLIDTLLMDTDLLSDPSQSEAPLIVPFMGAAESGVDATFREDSTAVLELRIEEVFSAESTPPGTTEVLFEGYFEVPESGSYRITASPDAATTVTLQVEELPDILYSTADGSAQEKIDELRELRADVLYPIRFFVASAGGLSSVPAGLLSIQGEKGVPGNWILYPGTVLENIDRASILLKKVLQIMAGLQLSIKEMRYFGSHWDESEDLGFNFLPSLPDGEQSEQFLQRFLQLLRFADLRKNMAGGTKDLVDFVEAIDMQSVLGTSFEEMFRNLADMTRRDLTDIEDTFRFLMGRFAYESNLSTEEILADVWNLLQVVKRFHLPVNTIVRWTNPIPDAAAAREARGAIRANYNVEQWRLVAKSIFDGLRQCKRDALVQYLVHHIPGIETQEQLYEYLLVDPGMEPVVQTSRLRLAISSVQLFIQRCLLNLEIDPDVNKTENKGVHPSAIHSDYWQWMKRYRVWEANRKILLYPENWLEPEFRDDKTHLFRELESTLLQGDITNDMAEDAFFNYLNGLEEIARLDIATLYSEERGDPETDVLHVIGRTFSLPHKYYYRRFAQRMWTPWEPVSAEIKGDQLVAAVWRERLYLFWLTILEKPGKVKSGSEEDRDSDVAGLRIKLDVEKDGDSEVESIKRILRGITEPIPDKESDVCGLKRKSNVSGMEEKEEPEGGTAKDSSRYRTYEAQLNWCEYFQGQWKPQQTAGIQNVIKKKTGQIFDMSKLNVYVYKEYEEGEESGLRINLGVPFEESYWVISRNGAPEIRNAVSFQDMPYFKDADTLRVQYPGRIEESRKEGEFPNAVMGQTNVILENCSSISVKPCCNTVVYPAVSTGKFAAPFFIQDRHHTFFVRPEMVELPADDWEGWATNELKAPLGGKLALDNNLNVVAAKPDLAVQTMGMKLTAPKALTANLPRLNTKKDWLLNSETVLKFGGSFIGPAGRLEIQEVDADAVGDGATDRVNVNMGSEISKDRKLVVAAGERWAWEGGLTVIGEGGANHAAVKTINTRLNPDIE